MKNAIKTVILIRGLPGSGKSTLAKKLCEINGTDSWFEADMYFDGPRGYQWNPKELDAAHDWCQMMFARALQAKEQTVIVSNTFMKRAHMEFYKHMAKVLGYKVKEIICTGEYNNVHGVPKEKVEKMRKEFEL